MGEYGWLTGPEFEEAVHRKVSGAAAKYGMRKFRADVVRRLMSEVRRRQADILTSEATRPPAARRSMADALDSTEFLIRYAAEFAKRQGRKVLTWDDVNAVLRDSTIDFWPFS